MTNRIAWLSIKAGLLYLVRDWRLWLLATNAYLMFSADYVVRHFGFWPAYLILSVLLIFSFWTIRLGVEQFMQLLRRRGEYRED